MQALTRSRAAWRRATSAAPSAPRRGLAADHGPEVTWAEYRGGEKTLSEWVDSNRHYVAFGFFVFYCSLAAWNLRPKKSKAKKADDVVEATPTSSA